MTFKEIMADKKAKRWAYLSWSLSPLPLLWTFYSDTSWYPALLYSFWMLIGPFSYKTQNQFPDFFSDPLSQLRLEGKMLHVKQHQVEIAHVSRVAIDKMDDHTAFIDFPYNMFGKLKFSFPTQELPAVKAFFQRHCPHIQIIS